MRRRLAGADVGVDAVGPDQPRRPRDFSGDPPTAGGSRHYSSADSRGIASAGAIAASRSELEFGPPRPIKALRTLNLRGNLAQHAQPEVFYVDPRRGLKGLKKILGLDSIPRTIDGVDIAHLGGTAPTPVCGGRTRVGRKDRCR